MTKPHHSPVPASYQEALYNFKDRLLQMFIVIIQANWSKSFLLKPIFAISPDPDILYTTYQFLSVPLILKF